MVQKICERNHHGFGQAPPKASGHRHSIAFIKKLLFELMRKDLSVAVYYILENVKRGFELGSHFLQKG
jgi:hypothetical protein